MDRLSAMQIFSTVMECGSFSAAARKLDKPQTTVSRQVKDLEEYLGVQLVLRSTRNLVLTDAGEKYLASSREILSTVSEIERDARGEYREPKGTLMVTAPIIMGRMHVFPLIAEYLKCFADVRVKLHLSDQNMHLYEDVIDVAIRVGQLPDSDFVAKRVGKVQKILCASPEYLAQHGVPKGLSELTQHSCITFEGLDSATHWRFQNGDEEQIVPIDSRIKANSTDIAVHSARQGLGIARVLSYQALPWIKAGELKLVLQDYAPDFYPVHMLYIKQDFLPLKQRSFIDFMAPKLKAAFSRISEDWEHCLKRVT